MATLEDFSVVLSHIYDAAMDHSRWDAALTHLVGAVGGTKGALMVAEPRVQILRAVAVDSEPLTVKEYNDYYFQLDTAAAALGRSPAGTMLPGSAVIQRSGEFYHDWVLPNEVSAGFFATLARGGQGVCGLIVAAPTRAQPFETTARLQFMRLVVPHVQQAIRMQSKLRQLQLMCDQAFEALDRLPYGVVILAGSGKTMFVNRSATKLCGRNDALAVTGTGLRATPHKTNGALQQLISRAAGAERGTPPSGGSLRIARPSARAYVILALPLSSTIADVLQLPSGVLLVIAAPDLHDQPSTAGLEELFGLTAAEAAVAVRTLGGRGLQAVADDLAVTLSTVRIHLQRVFEKTDTHRQAELVRLLLDLRPALPTGENHDV